MFINDLFNDKDKSLNEVSNELLGRYKKAAGADASAADKRGDIERGNKRFRGIVKATVKQGENDVKRHKEQDMAEGKKRSDTYHIVNKDGKPANLASYADKESAVKDRDAKHQGAEVRQLGPRGKVKGVAEGSELKQAKRRYNQAAKDANLDQVGAGKKIDTMKKSLRQKDLGKEQVMAEGSSILDILDVPEKVLRTAQDAARGMPTGTVPGGKDDLGSAAGDLANTATKVGKQVIDTARDAARGMPTGTVPKPQKDKGVDEDNSYMDSRPSSVTAKQADELGAAAKRAFKPEYYEPDTEPAPKRRDWDYSDPDIQPLVKDYLNKNIMDKKPMTYVDKVDESGHGRNRGYTPGFASPNAPRLGGRRQNDESDAVNNIEVSINGRPWKVFAGKGSDSSPEFFRQKQAMDSMCKRKTLETGKEWSWGVTGAAATNEGKCNMTEQGRSCPAHGIMECPGYSRLMGEAFKMPPESLQDRMHRKHQELRKKSGLPDPSHYKELAKKKQQEIDALRAEIAADKDKGLTEERYLEELQRAGYDLITEKKTKQRLDPKCWTGYKKQGTKIKGGVRVNNCVPNK